MKRGQRILDAISAATELPTEATPSVPLVELAGYSRVLVENHRGVVQYTCTQIRIKVSYGQISIQGSGLMLSRMTKSQLVISGCIDGICVCREK